MKKDLISPSHTEAKAIKQVKLTSRQTKLLESYLKLCSEVGVEAATLQKLAKYAKVALGSVHYHFNPDKNGGLVNMAIRYVDQESVLFINSALEKKAKSDNFKGLEDYIHILFEWFKTFPHHGKFYVYFYYRCTIERQNSAIAQLSSQYIALMSTRIQSLIFLCIGRGIYPKLKEIDSLTLKIQSVILGTLILCAVDPDEKNLDNYMNNAIAGIKQLILAHGILA